MILSVDVYVKEILSRKWRRGLSNHMIAGSTSVTMALLTYAIKECRRESP